jgi:CBS domain-containing protein
MQTTIRHILEVKGNDVWSIAPGASVFEALRMMNDKDIGALIVMDGDRMVGILSERDYARKVILLGKTSRDTLVGEIMSKNVFTIHPDQTIEEAMGLMNSKHIRHLPVTDGDRLMGVISAADMMRAIIFKQRTVIRDLQNKIQS